MRILLDENLNWRLERALPGHLVASVQRNGMAGLRNGELLVRAAAEFDVFLTMDGNIAFRRTTRNCHFGSWRCVRRAIGSPTRNR